MIRSRIPSDGRGLGTGVWPAIVLVPRVVASPVLGLDWILESTFARWIEGALERGLRLEDPRLLLDPAGAIGEGPRMVLVFDQLVQSTYERVLPWLHDLSVPFAVCVATSTVGRAVGRRRGGEKVPAWRDLAAIAAVGGILGTRGHFDVDHRSLAPEQVFHDLTVARCEVENRLGVSPWLLRYPGAEVSAPVASLAAQIGYRVGLCASSSSRAVGDPLRWPAWRPRPWHGAQRVLESSLAISARTSS